MCSVEECTGRVRVRGLCNKHYLRLLRSGSTSLLTTEDRFWAKVRKNDPLHPGCWVWTGSLYDTGYGQFRASGSKESYAHRWAWILTRGPIGPGLHLDHVESRGCTTRACVNPDHLEPVAPRTNILRGQSFAAVNARKTHCSKGHQFTSENTRMENGWRRCRTCDREKQRARRLLS